MKAEGSPLHLLRRLQKTGIGLGVPPCYSKVQNHLMVEDKEQTILSAEVFQGSKYQPIFTHSCAFKLKISSQSALHSHNSCHRFHGFYCNIFIINFLLIFPIPLTYPRYEMQWFHTYYQYSPFQCGIQDDLTGFALCNLT